jgi:hypothetical protein
VDEHEVVWLEVEVVELEEVEADCEMVELDELGVVCERVGIDEVEPVGELVVVVYELEEVLVTGFVVVDPFPAKA